MTLLLPACRSTLLRKKARQAAFGQCREASTTFVPQPISRLALAGNRASLDNFENPLHLSAHGSRRVDQRLTSTLRDHANDAIVDVEVGRYDKPGFDHVQVPLASYLDLLTQGNAFVGSQPVHLAQWRAFDVIPTLATLFAAPDPLSALVSSKRADIYQTSLFVGPNGAVTPLHRDPYENIFVVAEASEDSAKHVLLFPPACDAMLAPARGSTSKTVDVYLSDVVKGAARLESDTLNETELAELAKSGLAAELAQGDMLILPRGWWHRIENVGSSRSYVAGMAWWWLMRTAGPGSDRHCTPSTPDMSNPSR
jgi:hypothetical protein